MKLKLYQSHYHMMKRNDRPTIAPLICSCCGSLWSCARSLCLCCWWDFTFVGNSEVMYRDTEGNTSVNDYIHTKFILLLCLLIVCWFFSSVGLCFLKDVDATFTLRTRTRWRTQTTCAFVNSCHYGSYSVDKTPDKDKYHSVVHDANLTTSSGHKQTLQQDREPV